jgi:hypothetical protein
MCIDDLRPASFRGVGFHVASEKSDYGRRIITHEYPMRDNPYNEDMGEKAQKFHVSAYLFGDDWKAKKDAIVAACRARGPALLQLPTDAPKLVVCNSISVSRTKDECGFYQVTLEFTGADNASMPLGVGMFEGLIGALLGPATSLFTAAYDRSVIIRDVLDFVPALQTSRITQFSSDAIAAVEGGSSNSPDLSTDIVQASISVFQNASMYAQPDAVGSLILAAQPIAAKAIGQVETLTGYVATGSGTVTVRSGAAAIVPMVAYVMNGIGNSMPVDDAIRTLTEFATWSVNETSLSELERRGASSFVTLPSRPISPSEIADAKNGTLFCGVVRSFALMKLAQAISVKAFVTQREAVQARATIVELFNSQIALLDEDEIVNTMLSARDYAVRAVTQRMANIAPVIEIVAPQSRPSLYWAHRLYGDVYRAEELADRNSVASPGFMPSRFEALAR